MSAEPLIARVLTNGAPKPGGHYAQAVVSGAHVFVSGQLPIRADGLPLEDNHFETQARQAIQNMLEVLRAAGTSPQNLLKVTAYIVDIANWPRFNAVYASMLSDACPARSVVPVPELHYGYLVEIDAIAARQV